MVMVRNTLNAGPVRIRAKHIPITTVAPRLPHPAARLHPIKRCIDLLRMRARGLTWSLGKMSVMNIKVFVIIRPKNSWPLRLNLTRQTLDNQDSRAWPAPPPGIFVNVSICDFYSSRPRLSRNSSITACIARSNSHAFWAKYGPQTGTIRRLQGCPMIFPNHQAPLSSIRT